MTIGKAPKHHWLCWISSFEILYPSVASSVIPVCVISFMGSDLIASPGGSPTHGPTRRANRVLEFPEILRHFCKVVGIKYFSLVGQSLGASYALRCAQVNGRCKVPPPPVAVEYSVVKAHLSFILSFYLRTLHRSCGDQKLVRRGYYRRTSSVMCRGFDRMHGSAGMWGGLLEICSMFCCWRWHRHRQARRQ